MIPAVLAMNLSIRKLPVSLYVQLTTRVGALQFSFLRGFVAAAGRRIFQGRIRSLLILLYLPG